MTRPQDPSRLSISCMACDGFGSISTPKAVVGGGTAVVTRTCTTCEGTGRRIGLHPPV